jgi:hypothetical protein
MNRAVRQSRFILGVLVLGLGLSPFASAEQTRGNNSRDNSYDRENGRYWENYYKNRGRDLQNSLNDKLRQMTELRARAQQREATARQLNARYQAAENTLAPPNNGSQINVKREFFTSITDVMSKFKTELVPQPRPGQSDYKTQAYQKMTEGRALLAYARPTQVFASTPQAPAGTDATAALAAAMNQYRNNLLTSMGSQFRLGATPSEQDSYIQRIANDFKPLQYCFATSTLERPVLDQLLSATATPRTSTTDLSGGLQCRG